MIVLTSLTMLSMLDIARITHRAIGNHYIKINLLLFCAILYTFTALFVWLQFAMFCLMSRGTSRWRHERLCFFCCFLSCVRQIKGSLNLTSYKSNGCLVLLWRVFFFLNKLLVILTLFYVLTILNSHFVLWIDGQRERFYGNTDRICERKKV